jgi:CHAD domain-containing protein
MAYQIGRKAPVDAELRQILGEQNRRALALLQTWQDNPRDNVHQARQAMKRIRAVFRLVRPRAPYVYRVENVFYRDVGRSLACARDAEAVVEALTLLQPRIQGPLAQESLAQLRTGLERRAARQRESELLDLRGRIERACASLGAAERRLRHVPLSDVRRKDLRRGVEATLQRCGEAYERVCQSQAPDDFHAWRKDVKCAYHQSRLMSELMPHWSRTAGPGLGALAEVLGHLHDLVLLEALLGQTAGELRIDVHLRSIGRVVRLAKAECQAEAMRGGQELGITAIHRRASGRDVATSA